MSSGLVWLVFLEVSKSQILLPVTVLSPSSDESTLNLAGIASLIFLMVVAGTLDELCVTAYHGVKVSATSSRAYVDINALSCCLAQSHSSVPSIRRSRLI